MLAEVSRAVSLPLLAAEASPSCLGARRARPRRRRRVMAPDRSQRRVRRAPDYKTRLVEAAGRGPALTRLFDVGWNAPHRVLRNSTYQRWEAAGRPEAGQRPSEGEEVAPGILRYALNMPLSATQRRC